MESDMSNHTPGPWEAKPSCCGPHWGWHVNGPPEGEYRDGIFEFEADAKLVAAAPDLLAACQAAERRYSRAWVGGTPVDTSSRRELEQLRAAIAKATDSTPTAT